MPFLKKIKNVDTGLGNLSLRKGYQQYQETIARLISYAPLDFSFFKYTNLKSNVILINLMFLYTKHTKDSKRKSKMEVNWQGSVEWKKGLSERAKYRCDDHRFPSVATSRLGDELRGWTRAEWLESDISPGTHYSHRRHQNAEIQPSVPSNKILFLVFVWGVSI